ncbi:MAG: hypothetical protein AVDCRST_MAG71-2819 [uncultured Lysobacter sp.]|uniref:Uncharacterized protein n=1 Tax=uncultured Lysobacter sp. TaxID=271060 RepID=A0A6J4MCN1_9GAMM|nr:MAG: hypothetical protein AVDCRST_MAG71-2819 [uncultured Lysobacter sp.]
MPRLSGRHRYRRAAVRAHSRSIGACDMGDYGIGCLLRSPC